jgi:hypothetical protein
MAQAGVAHGEEREGDSMISDFFLMSVGVAGGFGICRIWTVYRLEWQAARIRELQRQVDAANAHIGELVRQDRALVAAFRHHTPIDDPAEQGIGRNPVDPWLAGEGRG